MRRHRRPRRDILRSLLTVLSLLAGGAEVLSAQALAPTPPGQTQLAWDHDGVDVTGFTLVVDGARTDLGMVLR
ncbi:MAG: hypothetical protein ACREJP_05265, partial [Candidatus Methylomirabilales bacterium]